MTPGCTRLAVLCPGGGTRTGVSRSIRGRRRPRWRWLWLGLGALGIGLGSPASAQPSAPPAAGNAESAGPAVADPDLDGPAYPVSHFEIRYEDGGDGLPRAEGLLATSVELVPTPSGWVAPRGEGRGEPRRLPTEPDGAAKAYHASALGAIAGALVGRLREEGLVGVYVAPDPEDIALATERDLRGGARTALRLVVSVGRVARIRSVGFGDRLPDDWRVDHRVHRRIRERSPIQPRETARPETTDRVDTLRLEEYLQRLNRHPGRRVDAALAPAEGPGGVNLDFRVTETRPWFVYAQTSNSGTSETSPWQTRVGAIHQQITNRDDILSAEYLNSGGEAVNGVNVGYEAPWLGSERPRWLDDDTAVPGWLEWVPRSAIPWPGNDRIRWRLFGGYSEARADDVDFTDSFTNEDFNVGTQMVYQAFQHRALFLDLYAGFDFRFARGRNRSAATTVQLAKMYVGEVGARLERIDEVSTLAVDVGFESTLDRVCCREQFLGRPDPDRTWRLLRWNGTASTYLEPLLFPGRFRDPDAPGPRTLAHELAFDTRGQWAFDGRLIPQVSQVIGGFFSVRGYPQSLAVGDSVAIGTLEYRFHLARSLPQRTRPVQVPFLGSFRVAPQQAFGRADWDLIFRGFVDAGRSWRHDKPAGLGERNETLVSAGVGLELQLGQHLRARVDWSRALKDAGGPGDRASAGTSELHFLFSVLY